MKHVCGSIAAIAAPHHPAAHHSASAHHAHGVFGTAGKKAKRASFREIDNYLRALPRGEPDRADDVRTIEQAAIARDQLHRTITFERKIVKAGVRSIEDAQPQLACLCVEHSVFSAVDEYPAPAHAHHPCVHAQRVNQPPGSIDHAVLHDQRNVVDAIVARQVEALFLVIADIDRRGEPGIDLRPGFALQVRMIPVERGPLANFERGAPAFTGTDQLMRSAIGCGRKFETMPMDRSAFGQIVVDMELHPLAPAHFKRRSQIGCVDADGGRSNTGDEFLLAWCQRQAENPRALLYLATLQGRYSERIGP